MGGAALVGGEVEASAAPFVVVEDGVGVRNEGVFNGGGVVGAKGSEKGRFAAGSGDGGAGGTADGSGSGGDAVGKGDEAACVRVTGSRGGAGIAGGVERAAGHGEDGDARGPLRDVGQ